MIQYGVSRASVTSQLGVHRCIVNHLWVKYGQTASVIDRPAKPDRQQDRNLRIRHLRDRKIPATSTATRLIGLTIIAQTVIHRLKEAGPEEGI
jgi:hypothetical protein